MFHSASWKIKKLAAPGVGRFFVISMSLLMGFAGINLLAYNHARTMLTFTVSGQRTACPETLGFAAKIRVLFKGITIPRPHSELAPTTLSPQCQVVLINSSNNTLLSTWYCDQGKHTPLVILFHGYGAEKTDLLLEAKNFLGMGSSVLLVDFRGSGGSSANYTTIGFAEADDVAAVVRYTADNFDHSSIILYGKSMGAAAVLRAIATHGITPDAVIIEAVFDTMLNTVRNRFAAMGVPSFPGAELLVLWGGIHAGFNGFAHNPLEYAKTVSCPILFMHGAKDVRARLSEARRVFIAVPNRVFKKFVEFPDLGHESYLTVFPDQWRESVLTFMGRIADLDQQHQRRFRF